MAGAIPEALDAIQAQMLETARRERDANIAIAYVEHASLLIVYIVSVVVGHMIMAVMIMDLFASSCSCDIVRYDWETFCKHIGDGKLVLTPWCELIESEEWVKNTTKVQMVHSHRCC